MPKFQVGDKVKAKFANHWIGTVTHIGARGEPRADITRADGRCDPILSYNLLIDGSAWTLLEPSTPEPSLEIEL